jgi:UDP-N-acetyl-D-mannosaminuronic acid dehydrogenase
MKFNYDVCIIGGLGHVGLPLGISLADAGHRVMLFDINEETASKVRLGQMPFVEPGAETALKRVIGSSLFITSDRRVIAECHFLVVVIGTPVDEYLNPRLSEFKEFLTGIMPYLSDDQHIILRSTIFPGTTEKVRDLLRSSGKGTKVSFCPERIVEGRAMEELRSLPQIISSFDASSLDEVRELFLTLTKEVAVLEPMEAELAKLFTNVWRYTRFAISNQLYTIAAKRGLDFYRIRQAIAYKYPRADDIPSAGFAAGPCLFKDAMQLSSFSDDTFFVHAAMLVNEGLPDMIVQRLKGKYNLKYLTVGILGMAFKGDSDDARGSLAYKLKKILTIAAKQVVYTDPYIEDAGKSPIDEVLKANIIILGAPHSIYSQVVLPSATVVVDIWNFFGDGGDF